MLTTLADDLATVFTRACAERDLEVAEFLMQALELVAARDGDNKKVECALLYLADTIQGQRSH